MTSPLPRIEDLTRLRRLYAMRGPRDGRAGVTPDGTLMAAIRWSLRSVVEDACAALRLGKADHARWRAAMGMDEPAEVVPSVSHWSDDCPARGPGLSHARLRTDPAGTCSHCGLTIV